MTIVRSVLAIPILATAALLCASPVSPPTSGNVRIVDDDGPGPYTTIQAAVAAAQDGDVLLVQSGTYASFLITNKELTIVADGGAQVTVLGGARVRDLAATRTVVLANLDVYGSSSTDEELSTGLFLANNSGHVRIESCVLVGGTGPTGNGVTVTTSLDVALVACDVSAGLRSGTEICYANARGGMGLATSGSSRVTVYGSTIRGGNGLSATMCACWGTHAGDGGNLLDTILFSANSTFQGGRGGNCVEGSGFSCPQAGDGGDGIQAFGAQVYVFDSDLLQGFGGGSQSGLCGSCAYTGYIGVDRRGATFNEVYGSARTLSSPTPVHAGMTQSITVRGQPGDLVGLLIGDSTQTAAYIPEWRGMLLVPVRASPLAQRFIFLGTVPANGLISYPLDIPALAPGAPARNAFLQALFVDALDQRTLSGARSMTILP